ncbi:MAG: apolipoprotein N-acyltransferase [Myxococcales bacterium]|nr:apolipoprotein N-acyltransferase [Myxococcales bacterium]
MRCYLLAAFGGCLYFLGFAGFDVWPLALIAFVPLLGGLEHVTSVRRALSIGLTFGVVLNLGGYSWLLSTLEVFAGFPWLVCASIFALICVLQGGQVALFAALLVLLRRRGRVSLLWAVPCWGVAELGYPLVFPTYLASSLHTLVVPSQVVELGGPIPLSMGIVLVNAAIFGWLRARLRRVPASPWLLPAGVIVPALCLGYGLVRVPQVDQAVAAAATLRVGMVQANMGLQAKRTDRREGRRRHIEQSRALERSHRPDLIVWPETAVAAPIALGVKRVEPILGSLATPVLFGALSHSAPQGRARLHNSAILADVNGKVQGRAHKRYLLPFAEYIPLGERFPALYDFSANSGRFAAGEGSPVVQLGPHRMGVMICYEDLMPSLSRLAANDGATLLVNLTNDAWFGDTRAPHIHLALSKLRAIEQRRTLLRATNSGVSAIIDPLGQVTKQSRLFERTTLAADVPLLDDKTIYARLGDWPAWLALVTLLLGIAVRRQS